MNAETRSSTVQQDARFLASLVRRLLWVRLVWRALVLVASLGFGVMLAKWVLNFGAKVSYAGFDTLGPQVVSVLTRINPYIWWAIVMVGVLIMLSWLRRGYQHSLAVGGATIVSMHDTQMIVSRVSNNTLDVIQWVWNAERNPLTVGDLQRAMKLVRNGKADQLKLARAQAQLIESALSTPPPEIESVLSEPSHKTEPVLIQP
jgi:hypothetical protein